MSENIDKLPSTDFDKKLFHIQITACEGGIHLQVSNVGDYKHTFHELIGILEYAKHTVVGYQREKNSSIVEARKKHKEP